MFTIPEGDYNKLEFVLGVDRLRNTMGISQMTGVLDPGGIGSGMYWTWNSGYIFFKMEGSSSILAESTDYKYRFYISGFGGYTTPTFNNIKVIQLDLTENGIAREREGWNSELHLLFDIQKVFSGDENVDLTLHNSLIMDDYSKKIANNYSQGFKHTHTHN